MEGCPALGEGAAKESDRKVGPDEKLVAGEVELHRDGEANRVGEHGWQTRSLEPGKEAHLDAEGDDTHDAKAYGAGNTAGTEDAIES